MKTTTATNEQESTTAGTKTTAGKTRRGRRGGARRKPAAKAEQTTTTGPELAPVIPLGVEPQSPTTPISQQEATLRELTEQQIAALKGLQGSLSAIENRLIGLSHLVTERPRVGIFVDVPNVMYAADRVNVKLDYKKLLDFLIRGRELVRASAYAPISDAPQANLDTQKFVEPFLGHGYRMVTKPHKRYADGSMKANFDVELAMDVLTMSDRLDTVTLVSGDGDFRRLVEIVASKGIRVEVVAFGDSTAAELRAVADEYTDLSDHISELRLA